MTAARDGRAPTQFSEVGARRHTKKLRAKVGEALDLIAQAWEGRIWDALPDVSSWSEYLDTYVPEVKDLRLAIDVRRDAVAEWAARGMSQKAMADGLNVSVGTINADVAAVVPVEENATVISLDNRRRPARVRREVIPPPVEPPAGLSQVDRAIQLVAEHGDRGLTVKELCLLTDWHHGTASAALSKAHNKRHAIRPSTTFRRGCAAYVLAE